MTPAITLDAHLCAVLAAFMRRAFGFGAAKQAATYADTSPRTTERWVRGKTAPNALQLLRLARHSGFRAELRAYLDFIEQQEADVLLRLAVLDEKCRGTIADLDRARFERARGSNTDLGEISAEQSDGDTRRVTK